MTHPGDSFQVPPAYGAAVRSEDSILQDFLVPLQNLSTVRSKMDSLQRFLSESIGSNTLISRDQMNMVSDEIASGIQQIFTNGTALLSCSQNGASVALPPPSTEVPETPSCKTPALTGSDISAKHVVDLKVEVLEEEEEKGEDEGEIVELDAIELLAEHLHFCEICGKGFRRDANLRMHMRAHGNQYKTPEALTKPPDETTRRKATRFSCPFGGCNRNKAHKKFRALKSVICVKNHFKRSHCPKMYSCNRCRKKSFSVLSDLKSHSKHCGESKWKCSCGTTFSRKDKLFGHMALFEGHMPAVMVDGEDKGKDVVAMEEEDHEQEHEDTSTTMSQERETRVDCFNDGFMEGFFDDIGGFGSIENYCLQDVLGFSDDAGYGGL